MADKCIMYLKSDCFQLISSQCSNVPCMKKPDSWFLIAKYLKKHLWKSDILSKDASHWPEYLVKASLYHIFFTHFDTKNQLTGLSITGTLAGNEIPVWKYLLWKCEPFLNQPTVLHCKLFEWFLYNKSSYWMVFLNRLWQVC